MLNTPDSNTSLELFVEETNRRVESVGCGLDYRPRAQGAP